MLEGVGVASAIVAYERQKLAALDQLTRADEVASIDSTNLAEASPLHGHTALHGLRRTTLPIRSGRQT